MTEYSGIAGNTLAYDVIGQGPLVVLAHGIGDSRHSFRFLAPAVAEAGYRVANVDIRGCGDSSLGWAAPTSPATWSPSCVTSVARRSSRAPATTCTPRPASADNSSGQLNDLITDLVNHPRPDEVISQAAGRGSRIRPRNSANAD